MFTLKDHKGFALIRYCPDPTKPHPKVGAITGIHRNELEPLVESGSINMSHPLIKALENVHPDFELLILANPFHNNIEYGQRYLHVQNGKIDPNRIAAKKHHSDLKIKIEHLEDETRISALLNRSNGLLAVARELFKDLIIFSLHADAPYWMNLEQALSRDHDIESYTYAYLSWNKGKFEQGLIEELWKQHIFHHPYQHLVADEVYLKLPEQTLGKTGILIGKGIIKDDDPILDGSFENQLVVEGGSPLSICFELPLTSISIQQRMLEHFFVGFLSPLLLK